MSAAQWHYALFHPVRLEGPEKTLGLERKTAACLAYLALEGATPRSRLAGLLWPESPESTARNNLVHLLRKLRQATGSELVQGSDLLCVDPELSVDALEARRLHTQGKHGEFLTTAGEPLSGLSYDDCPELDDWLLLERDRWLELRLQALRSEADHLEQQGSYLEALSQVRRLLDLDPVSEEAWRRTMRLYYLLGDRPAALRAYRRCKETLEREFRTEPLPETVALARAIDQGTVPVVSAKETPTLPLSLQRPPHLVGREREWARMEAAWQAGQVIFIQGEPGSGKTRLARDFAASKGEVLYLEGRPGDTGQPFASAARNLRTHLARCPEGALEGWERRELSRILPELTEPGVEIPPLSSEADTLRFKQAMLGLVRKSSVGLAAFVTDDLQYFDPASQDVGSFMMSAAFPLGQTGGLPLFIDTFRRGEVSPELEGGIQTLLEAGVAVLIDLEPLDQDGTEALLTDLGVPDHPQTRARLRQHSGGNPLFVLETVRHLLETGQLETGPLEVGMLGQDLPEKLPLPPRVGQIIERRLLRLSTPALQAARAAAVLQRDFDVELVAEVLAAPLLQLLSAWEELEAAQIVQGEGLSHDLVYEAIVAGIPAAVRPLLHRSAARVLERATAHPARIAQHWLEGGKPAQAAPLLRRAAQDALERYRMTECIDLLDQAGEAFWQAGLQDDAFEVWRDYGRKLFDLEQQSVYAEFVDRLEGRASTPRHKAVVYLLRGGLHLMNGDASQLAEVVNLGMDCVGQTGDLALEADLLELRFAVDYLGSFASDPTPWLERMIHIGLQTGQLSIQANAHALSGMYQTLTRPRLGLEHAVAAEAGYLALNERWEAVSCAQKVAKAHIYLGNIPAALDACARMAQHLDGSEGHATQRLFLLESRMVCALALGQYGVALEQVREAEGSASMHSTLWMPEIQAYSLRLRTELGLLEEVRREALALLEALPESPNQRPEPRVLLAGVLTEVGSPEEAKRALLEAERVTQLGVYWTAQLELVRVALLPPLERLSRLDALLHQSRDLGLRGLALAAEVRRNAARLELNLPPLPWEGFEENAPCAGVIGIAEVWAVRLKVAEVLGSLDLNPLREAARAWATHTAQTWVPLEHQDAFLSHPPVLALLSREKENPLERGAHARAGLG